MSEYSPLPGTVRSKVGLAEIDEPWTRKSTGSGRSPALGAPVRLRYMARETSPFLAAYSALHGGPGAATFPWASTGLFAPSARAPRPTPAATSIRRRDTRAVISRSSPA
jgi:hypothetical protein